MSPPWTIRSALSRRQAARSSHRRWPSRVSAISRIARIPKATRSASCKRTRRRSSAAPSGPSSPPRKHKRLDGRLQRQKHLAYFGLRIEMELSHSIHMLGVALKRVEIVVLQREIEGREVNH